MAPTIIINIGSIRAANRLRSLPSQFSTRAAARSDMRASLADASPAFTNCIATGGITDNPIEFSFRDMWPPFWEGRSNTAC